MKRNNFLILLILFTPTIGFSQVVWPFDDENTQATQVGTMGEKRGNGLRFHTGADLTNGADRSIYAINAGTATPFNGGGVWDSSSSIRVGDVSYIHCKPKASIINGTSPAIQVGDYIGEMIDWASIHVHLTQSNTNYLDENLSPYVDSVRPQVVTNRFAQGYEFYRNGLDRTTNAANRTNLRLNDATTIDNVSFTEIYSKIDIAADIEDRRVDPDGNIPVGYENNATAPFSMKYFLNTFDSNDTTNSLFEYDLTFDEVPNNAASDAVFHPLAAYTTFILTSHPRTTPYFRHFNTLIRENATEDWLNTNNLNASHISEAAFPDDKYRIYIDAFDVDFDDNPNNHIQNLINVPVLIDNFLPYLTKVEVVNTLSGIAHYKAEWLYANDILSFNKSVDLSLPTGIKLKVNSSEPLGVLAVTINNISYPLTSTDTTNKTWEVDLSASTSGLGAQILSFYGADYTGNELSINPTTLPTRLADGTWPASATTGEDTWHRVQFSGVGGSIFGADFSNGGYCIPDNTNKSNITGKIDPSSCLQVCFQDNSTPVNDISSWFWEFGDFGNSTSSSQNPSFQYGSPGTYDVKLTITNAQNQTRTTTKSIIVEECSSSITAQITANTSSGAAPLLIDFTDVTIGDIYNRTWNVPEGVQFISGDENSVNVTLLFPYTGSPQQVSLTIEDEYGDETTSNIIVINTSSQSTVGLLVDYAINGRFNTGSTLTFDSEVSQGCNNLSYQWTFNDYNGAHYSTLPTTTYSFPVPGDYTVKLCVTDNCGNQTCKTKNVAVSNFQSAVTADMWSSIGADNWTVLKGTEVTFYDNSESEGDIIYGSWFWDYENSSDAPDLFYWYTNKPASGAIKHTYNQVGTYKVRLYVGESVEYAGDFQEVTVTVVDEFDYLEIPVINEVNRQVFSNKNWSYIQLKNFGDYMLTMKGRESIEIYKRNGFSFSLNSTINISSLNFPLRWNGSNPEFLISGYNDQIIIANRNESSDILTTKVMLLTKIGSDWTNPTSEEVLNFSDDSHIDNLRIRKNTLVVNRYDSSGAAPPPQYPEWYTSTKGLLEVYELEDENEFVKTAQLVNPRETYDQDGFLNSGFADEIALNENLIVVKRRSHGVSNVFEKTENGWVNSLPVATLYSDHPLWVGVPAGIQSWNYNLGTDGTIAFSTNLEPSDVSGGLAIFESENGTFSSKTQDAMMRAYVGNVEDDRTTGGYFRSAVLSDNNNFVVSTGGYIRDFSLGVLRLFYKEGNQWLSKNKEDYRLYPLGITSSESLDGFREVDNTIFQFTALDSNPSSSGSEDTVIYAYDLDGKEGVGSCYQDLTFANKQINNFQTAKDGKNISISNTTITENGRVEFRGVNIITFLPNTTIKAGAIVKASIVDCNEIE